MRALKSLVVAALVGGGIAVAGATPAQAAYSTCTSWSTYDTTYSTSYVQHIPSVGYHTGRLTCQLKSGNNNDAVTVLQRALRYCHGYSIGIDGEFGPQTKAAVLGVQRRANSAYGAGIAEDGEYGPQTADWIHWPVWTKAGNTMTNRCELSPV
ncbi:peptidoglycan-binding protein [Micromonospora terminaliae]|uniref:Peptidoglycan-binding protein n=1 Tax=Micromonospora terminaliae TaxID=1914461 RepID=A0AAJ2ZL22_9ACTN|nr:peptidoglycan-binding domain-containing protein [Micromonospora terminaliae]NES31781.1 peptidoglycan-binding protein [Micromonospora terminaliae]QGL49870.1 peptidoglycan-binding protein [Micromonospora terminaliae]